MQGKQWQFSSHSQYLQWGTWCYLMFPAADRTSFSLGSYLLSGMNQEREPLSMCESTCQRGTFNVRTQSYTVPRSHGTLHPRAAAASCVPSDPRLGPLRCPKCCFQRAAALTNQSRVETLREITLELWPNVWIDDLLGPPSAITSISENLHHLKRLHRLNAAT